MRTGLAIVSYCSLLLFSSISSVSAYNARSFEVCTRRLAWWFSFTQLGCNAVHVCVSLSLNGLPAPLKLKGLLRLQVEEAAEEDGPFVCK